MTRLKTGVLLVLFTLVFSHVPNIVQADGSGAFVAVYNSGRALVRETRVVTLPQGPAAVVFTDIPASLEPASVRAVADGMTVKDVEYSYHPITAGNLLDAYVGKELSVILPDPSDANARILRQATLLSNEGQPVFSVGNEIYVGRYEALLLPKIPKDFDAEPTLTLTTQSAVEGKKNVSLSYLMGGVNWHADYTMTLSKSGTTADLDAWATIVNTSGRAFKSADVRLVAGDVQRAPAPRLVRNKAVMAMESAPMDSAGGYATEETFSQYHVYSVGRYISLPADGSKQVGLFSATDFPVKQKLTSRFNSGPGQRNGKISQPVELALSFENTEMSKIGRSMPEGLVRVFMPTADGMQLLAGETRISHTAIGNEVRLVLGRSFDVTVERTQTHFKKVGKNSFEIGWKITARNGMSAPQDLTLRESFPASWKVLSADAEYTEADAGTIEFSLASLLPTKGTEGKIINYMVQIEY
ncbi:DUF4139 domain-containing protein [uncultured Pseudodesulfovibrio sp.]|uniref:DUF4139 domain-containing protein n=1 Tax=uncultured Pseudodesulfovibrio sp. TaxID=2035858 RepID=UPI0029C8056A|nr:DUF4139 domain-containing protein [uncultured Pseudodesulfovibrio sp.]